MERYVPADRIIWHVQKQQSKSIQYGGHLSNVLTMCFYSTNSRYIKVCCQNDAICYEFDVIL